MRVVEFTNSRIPVIPFEDDDINPGVLGRGLADWLKSQLADTDFPITEVVPEDWGYCAFVRRKPYWLYVGLAGSTRFEWPEAGLTQDIVSSFPLESVKWQLWVKTEMGWLSKLTGSDNRKRDASTLTSLIETKLLEAGIQVTPKHGDG